MRFTELAALNELSVAGALLVLTAVPTAGAEESAALPTVPRFEIAASPIGLRGDVRPRQYLGVVGPRSAWLGSETGEAELIENATGGLGAIEVGAIGEEIHQDVYLAAVFAEAGVGASRRPGASLTVP